MHIIVNCYLLSILQFLKPHFLFGYLKHCTIVILFHCTRIYQNKRMLITTRLIFFLPLNLVMYSSFLCILIFKHFYSHAVLCILKPSLNIMYSRTSILTSVNEARMNMYFSRTQNIENIPPTKNTFLFHTKRALFQSVVWSRCLDVLQNLPLPKDFWWKESDNSIIKWIPYWMSQSEASKECREFIKCACKATCSTSRYTYKGADLRCTLLCKCNCSHTVRYE